MNANPLTPRRISLSIATVAVALLAGCGTNDAGHAGDAASNATPTASPALASTTSRPADPCSWLTKEEAQTLLGTTLNTVFDGLGSPLGSMTDGPLECSYSPGSLEEAASPAPGSGDTGASVSILDSASFAEAQKSAQPQTVSYTVTWVPASTIFPGASSGVRAFYAISITRPDLGHATWTYLNVQLGGGVYFRVGMVDPFLSEAQREAKDQAAALDVLSNLKLHP
jgi:hypothetical protein